MKSVLPGFPTFGIPTDETAPRDHGDRNDRNDKNERENEKNDR